MISFWSGPNYSVQTLTCMIQISTHHRFRLVEHCGSCHIGPKLTAISSSFLSTCYNLFVVQNAIAGPHYYMNSHGLIYVIRGSARVQVVGDSGQTAFDGKVWEGQFLVIPQNFVAIQRASEEGFEWIGFRTNDVAMVNRLAGRLSVLQSLPEEVIENAYDISREESRRLKYGREEVAVFSPGSSSRGSA